MGLLTTSPSPFEVGCPIRKVAKTKTGDLDDQSGFQGVETTSGSVELRGIPTFTAGKWRVRWQGHVSGHVVGYVAFVFD